MAEGEKQNHDRGLRPVTDSPWFWLVLFLCAALVAVVVVSPKYAYRQARLERMNDTREQIQRGAASAAVETTDPNVLITEVAPSPAQPVTLGPLAVALALLLAVAAVACGVVGYLKNPAVRARRAGKKGAP